MPLRKIAPAFAGLLAFAAVSSASWSARAAEPYVARPLTLPPGNVAFDVGLGIGHYDLGGAATGPGLNFEAAIGLVHNLELGFRAGVRLTPDGQHVMADNFARMWDTETYDVGNTHAFSNPEVRLTWRAVNAEVIELGLEGRVYIPFEDDTHFGAAFGVPILLHLGRIVRLDTGGYLVTIFGSAPYALRDTTNVGIGIPARLWFQATDRLWMGPIFALHHYFTDSYQVPCRGPGGALLVCTAGYNDTELALGFGLGYQITRILDFKTQFLLPAVNQNSNYFGIGAGVQIRIE